MTTVEDETVARPAVAAEPTPTSEAATSPPKFDPETMVLRAKPSRAIRFKRQIIIGSAPLVAIVFVTVGYIALRPTVSRLIRHDEDRGAAARTTPDAVNALPATYAVAPKLGPPLPGDLGRGILEHQRAMAITPVAVEPPRVDQAAITERERQDADVKAARQSGLLVQSGARSSAADTPAAISTPAPAGQATKIALDPDHDPNSQQRKADFVSATDNAKGTDPHALTPCVWLGAPTTA